MNKTDLRLCLDGLKPLIENNKVTYCKFSCRPLRSKRFSLICSYLTNENILCQDNIYSDDIGEMSDEISRINRKIQEDE